MIIIFDRVRDAPIALLPERRHVTEDRPQGSTPATGGAVTEASCERGVKRRAPLTFAGESWQACAVPFAISAMRQPCE